MVEKYQLHWLNQTGNNQIVSNAFEQANKKSFKDLMAFSKKFKEEKVAWMFLEEDFDKIATFIISYPSSMKIAIKDETLPELEKMLAAKYFDIEEKALISLATGKINLNVKDSLGFTGFHLACSHGRKQLVEIMVRNSSRLKIDLDAKTYDDSTGFMLACMKNHPEVIEILMENSVAKKIDLNVKDNKGYTGFHLACSHGSTHLVEILARNSDLCQIDLNAKTSAGHTGFMLACMKNHSEVIEILMKHSAAKKIDLNARNNAGRTAFHLICYGGYYYQADCHVG